MTLSFGWRIWQPSTSLCTLNPHRVLALRNEPSQEKFVIRLATPGERDLVRHAIEQGREGWITASPKQRDLWWCSQWIRRARCVEPPDFCVAQANGFSVGPDVVLCEQEPNAEASAIWDYL